MEAEQARKTWQQRGAPGCTKCRDKGCRDCFDRQLKGLPIAKSPNGKTQGKRKSKSPRSCKSKKRKATSNSSAPAKRSKTKAGGKTTPTSAEPFRVEGDYVELEKIVDVRTNTNGTKEYKVRWRGFSAKHDEWVPDESLCDSAKEEATKFEQQKKVGKGNQVARKTTKGTNQGVKTRPSWAIPDGNSGLVAGNMQVRLMVFDPPEEEMEVSFASHYFGRRLLEAKIPLKACLQAKLPTNFTVNDRTYELLASKVKKETHGSNSVHWQERKAKEIRITYVATSGPGLKTISLKKELEKIAYFGKLSPEKASSRLEMIVSKSNKKMILDDEDLPRIEVTKDQPGNDGCGFMPESMAMRYGCTALQVRVFSPHLGCFKGILFPKRNIDHIELPRSMRKVPPSQIVQDKKWSCMIVKGTFPAVKNKMIGRQLDPETKDPPMSYFKSRSQAPSPMILRLWESLGVPSDVITKYCKRCDNKKTIKELKHASLLGAADPTGALPKGRMFVTGMGTEQGKHDKLFISRFPCLEPSDGRMVAIVNTKPKAMKVQDWEWLLSFPFGFVIFGGPRDGSLPLPLQIAQGDIDGDSYFTCWDSEILESVQQVIRAKDTQLDSKLVRSAPGPCNNNWLKAAQDVMRETERKYHMNSLTGKLYTMAENVGNLKDRKSVMLARGYKESLDLPKHGGKIKLPEEIEGDLPRKLHANLCDSGLLYTRSSA